MCGYVHENAGPHRVQKKALDALEPEAEVGGCGPPDVDVRNWTLSQAQYPFLITEPILQS